MERAVGWFILLATLLLLFGFGYYIYKTAESKGWFKIKAPYYTYAESGDGLSEGDPVKLMGFPAGQITQVTAMPAWGPGSEHHVFVGFEVLEPYYGYVLTTGSVVNLGQAGILNKRELNLSRGTGGYATYLTYEFRDDLSLDQARSLPHPEKWRLGEEIYSGTNLEIKAWTSLMTNLDKLSALGVTNLRVIDPSDSKKKLTAMWNEQAHRYDTFKKGDHYGLPPDETPPLTTQLQNVASQIEAALPNFLALTNQLTATLSNATRLTSNLDEVAQNARPVVTNLQVITAQLRNPKGSLGDWLIPTNISHQLETTLQSADGAVDSLNTNLITLNKSLDNLAGITSNLNTQVQVNSNILSNISDAVVHSDQFIQGLKRFWLFRHLFKNEKSNTKNPPAPIITPAQPSQSPVTKEAPQLQPQPLLSPKAKGLDQAAAPPDAGG